jgi:hypothetical protein
MPRSAATIAAQVLTSSKAERDGIRWSLEEACDVLESWKAELQAEARESEKRLRRLRAAAQMLSDHATGQSKFGPTVWLVTDAEMQALRVALAIPAPPAEGGSQ